MSTQRPAPCVRTSRSLFLTTPRSPGRHTGRAPSRRALPKVWMQHFGLASTEETDTYRPRPYSRSYVIHLDDWYAQSHPDEDFAETFAVWLTPDLNWRGLYTGWKALQKLEYVDELMRSIAG